jgi:YidC/Oxa1 family membrane protein insertase
MEKRLILAIALSVLVMVAFQFIFPAPKKTEAPAPAAIQQEQGAIIRETEPGRTQYTPPAPPPDEKTTYVATDRFVMTFSNIGGAVKKIELKDYKQPKTGDILALSDIAEYPYYLFSLKDTVDALRLDNSAYSLDTDGDKIIYALTAKNFTVTKTYTLHKSNNTIGLQISVRNNSSSPAEFGYKIITGSGMPEARPDDKTFSEVVSKVDGKLYGFKRPGKTAVVNPGIISWVASKTRYFSIIVKPYGQTKGEFHAYHGAESLYAGIEMERMTIPAYSAVENRFVVYAGPTIGSNLKKLGLEFEESINYGWFDWIAKGLLAVAAFFYMLVRNWGVAIILLSVFLNIILFPLTLKSFKSMQKMHELHPQMEKLKAQFKDQPQKLNKEVLELYKKYKINPMSGCLPLLLQMPIFVALYQALTKSIALRGAGFLWISDLSMPDAVPISFTLPIFGNSINVLPLLMVGLMVAQQKVSTKVMGGAVTDEQKQQQRMMLIIMPIMFGFIFYSMPSGMVLYWVVNTILTIAEQFVIFKNT